MLEAASYISHQVDINYVNDKAVSLGEALEWIIKLQEKRVKEEQIEYYSKVQTLLDTQKSLVTQVQIMINSINDNMYSEKKL